MAQKAAAIVSVIVILFFFTIVADACSPFDFPDDAASIILPTEQPDSKTQTKYATNEPETQTKNEPKPGTKSPYTVPLTVISFRPINRHFPRRPLLCLGHKCGHQFLRRQIRNHGRDLSYDDDMILSGDGEGVGLVFDLVSQGGEARMVPTKWSRIHRRGSRFGFKHGGEEKEEIRKPHHDHDHYSHMEGEVYEEEERREHKQQHKDGFMKKIRKFLDGDLY